MPMPFGRIEGRDYKTIILIREDWLRENRLFEIETGREGNGEEEEEAECFAI
jgi:hypothetical protein